MCGIAGILGTPDRDAVERMTAAMDSRGPDDVGSYADRWIALGHRRLSILDLSSAGHQPMSLADGKLWIVYNGEIYNFVELRRRLEARGRVFRSRSDTEVILALYEDMGTECVTLLRGMFAFAIWDRRTETPVLFMARDHFGIKPLLYAEARDGFVFASDLPGLSSSGRIPDAIDRVALLQFLTHGHVVQPRTILQGVRMLPPAHALTVRPGAAPRLWRYWDLDHERSRAQSAGLSLEERVDRVRALLENATRSQMVSDVPLGAFLSGGIDSCALVALMTRAAGRPMHTYSVGFAGAGAAIDETRDAERSAAALKTVHLNVPVTGREVAMELPEIARRLGQPTVDGVNMYFVSKAARRGVTVALSGLGGDEIFAGYSTFADLQRAWGPGAGRWSRLGAVLGRSGFWRMMPRTEARRAWEMRSLRRDLASDYMIRRMIRPPSVALELAGGEEPDREDLFAYLAEDDARVTEILSRVSRLEMSLYMGSQLLRDADAASMAHSLEVRVPFLDLDLVEFAYGLPGEAQRGPVESGGPSIGKRALVLALQDLLPAWTYRTPKRGFRMPFAEWLRGPLRPLAEETLRDAQFRSSGLLVDREIDRLWAGFLQGDSVPWTWVWTALMLALWWQGSRRAATPSVVGRAAVDAHPSTRREAL